MSRPTPGAASYPVRVMSFLLTLLGTLLVAGVIGYLLALFVAPEDDDFL